MNKLVIIIFLLVLPGCGITQALREMKEGVLDASKKMEFAPIGYHNNSYEEVVKTRQVLQEIKNRLDIAISPLLGQNPQLKTFLMQADFSIKSGKSIAKAITAYEFVAPIVNMPGNAVDYTMGDVSRFLSNNGELIKGGLGVSIPMAILGWGLSYFRRKKRIEAEEKLIEKTNYEHDRKMAEKQAEHDRKIAEIDKMHKLSMEVNVEKARLEVPKHIKVKKS